MSAPSRQVIRGELAFDGAPVDLTGASVRVRLDDVGRADAAARTEAEHAIDGLPRGTTTAAVIPFELDMAAPLGRGPFSLWAHVDVDHDGQVSLGDWITMDSVPVSPGRPAFHRVRLRRVE